MANQLINEELLFKAIREIAGRGLSQPEVDRVLAAARMPIAPVPLITPSIVTNQLTARVVLEVATHEAIVREAYKDSKGIWTWAIGVTDASGHAVLRYKDQPQTLEHCIAVSVWLMKNKYLPAVLEEFKGHKLTEAQLAAALSFHYNTGRIGTADWCDLWRAGRVAEAKLAIMNWKSPPEIIERREKERDLFFDGVWSGDGKITEWAVRKPGYKPDWRSGRRIDIRAAVEAALRN